MIKKLESNISRKIITFVCIMKGEFVGMCRLDFAVEDLPELNGLFVREDYRKSRVGSHLLKEAEQTLKELGGKFLYLRVDEKNPNVDFYKKRGYVVDYQWEEFLYMFKNVNT